MQLRLPLYSEDGATTHDDAWTLEREDLFVALLLECGRPPRSGLISPTNKTATNYIRRVSSAMEKYYRPACVLPIHMVKGPTLNQYLDWLADQME